MWTEEDQDKAIAYRMLESERCQGCGTNSDEWLEDGREIDPPPYVVTDRRCIGCKTKAQHHEALKDQDLSGVSFGLIRNHKQIEMDEIGFDPEFKGAV